ncbi:MULTISPECIES: hypothetical protein [Chroococcidiopsis]|nr:MULTISPECIES: hypothetical protein [Chroococcidiopsis]
MPNPNRETRSLLYDEKWSDSNPKPNGSTTICTEVWLVTGSKNI